MGKQRSIKDCAIFKNITSLTDEEKKLKTKYTYLICVISALVAFVILMLLNICHIWLIVLVASVAGMGYFLFGKTPVIKPKDKKTRKKVKKSLDEEYIDQVKERLDESEDED